MKITIQLLALLLLLGQSPQLKAQGFKTVEEAKGLLPGAMAPLFTTRDANNEEYSLENALQTGPVIMIFYRGYWCPHCNRHLSRIQDSLNLIYEKGASVIAISAEIPEYLEMIKEKTGSEFSLLYDEGFRISDAYDVTFLPENAKARKGYTDDSQRLPIPATYIIDRKGRITWRHFDPNYRKRSSVKEILVELSKIQSGG